MLFCITTVFVHDLNIWVILPVFLVTGGFFIPKLSHLVMLNNSINSIWILINVFFILICLTLFVYSISYIAGLLSLILGLDTLFGVRNFEVLSLDLALNYSKYILSHILLFILATVIIKLVLNSNSFKELLRNLGLLLLALFNLAFFSMIYTVILGDLVLPVLSVTLNLFDLDLGILKMDKNQPSPDPQPNHNPQPDPQPNHNPQPDPQPNMNPQPGQNPESNQNPQPNDNDQNRPELNNPQPVQLSIEDKIKVCHKEVRYKYRLKSPNGPVDPDITNGGDNCQMCTIINKVKFKMNDKDIKRSNNILFKNGKLHDLSDDEGELVRKYLNKINYDETFSIKKHDGIENEKLGATAQKAANGDLLMRGVSGDKYVSCLHNKPQLNNVKTTLEQYHDSHLREEARSR